MQQSLTQSCVNIAAGDPSNIGHFMNSVPVVEDMVAIIERHGEWREAVTEAFLRRAAIQPLTQHHVKIRQTHPGDVLREKRRWKGGQERLLYWSMAYGTIIGQLFAAVHPERVSRLLLDSVVNPSEYLLNTGHIGIEEPDDVFHRFFSYCSGAPTCPFRDEDEEKPSPPLRSIAFVSQ